jgi:hypothetical protein
MILHVRTVDIVVSVTLSDGLALHLTIFTD